VEKEMAPIKWHGEGQTNMLFSFQQILSNIAIIRVVVTPWNQSISKCRKRSNQSVVSLC